MKKIEKYQGIKAELIGMLHEEAIAVNEIYDRTSFAVSEILGDMNDSTKEKSEIKLWSSEASNTKGFVSDKLLLTEEEIKDILLSEEVDIKLSDIYASSTELGYLKYENLSWPLFASLFAKKLTKSLAVDEVLEDDGSINVSVFYPKQKVKS